MWLQVAFEASQSRRQSDGQRQTVPNNGPRNTKRLSLQIWFLFLEECSLGWWPNGDHVVLVHCWQRQPSFWGTEGICCCGPCTLTMPLYTGSDKWLATSTVLSYDDDVRITPVLTTYRTIRRLRLRISFCSKTIDTSHSGILILRWVSY